MADRLTALGVGALALAAYVLTLPPSFGMWDTAELQTVAAILGIAHPTGSPFFTLLGWTFVHVVPVGDPAWRVNVMCSFATALAVALAYSAAREFGARPAGAAVCALGFGFCLLVWRDATRAEVQALVLALRALAFVCALRFWRRGRTVDLVGTSLAAGLACATHGIALFVLPSLALLVSARPEGRTPRRLAVAAATFAFGLLPAAYLPLRSAFVDAHRLEPTLALGLPRGLAFWNYGDPSSPARFWRFVTGADFRVRGGFAGYLAWARFYDYLEAFCMQIANGLGYVGTMLALFGICAAFTWRRTAGIALALAALLPVPYAVAYPDLQDRERYYTMALWCAAVAAAIGFEALADLFELRVRSIGRGLAAAALAVSFVMLPADRAKLWDQRLDRTGPDYVADVRAFTPDDAIVLADWAYATPLAYAIYVERSLGHRVVVASSSKQYLTEAARWVRRRPVFFVGFDDDLRLAGWHVRRIKTGAYTAYRLTK